MTDISSVGDNESRLHTPFCSYFKDYRTCNCGYAINTEFENRMDEVEKRIRRISDKHGKLNDLFQIIKSQYQSGSLSLEDYQKALEIMSS